MPWRSIRKTGLSKPANAAFTSESGSGWATGFFLVGLVLVGTGFMVFCVDVLQATTGAYGGLGGALGLGVLRGRTDSAPPPQVIGATVVSLEGLLASAVGTTVLLALLGRLMDSGVVIDALWAKNLTYFFGHSIANLIIYLAAGMVGRWLPVSDADYDLVRAAARAAEGASL